YPPSHTGGTETYVSGLVRALRSQEIASRVIAPLSPSQLDGYEFDGTAVRTYAVNAAPSRAELRGKILHDGFSRFRELLAEERPDVYHQHSWSRGLGAAHLHAAREAGLRTVLTVHTPSTICIRGTMMRFGESACDGLIRPSICGACWSHGRGASKPVSRVLGALPSAIAGTIDRHACGHFGRLETALTAHVQGERRKEEFSRMLSDADRVVAVCEWLFRALSLNGVPEN